jgi:hypothetical protein
LCTFRYSGIVAFSYLFLSEQFELKSEGILLSSLGIRKYPAGLLADVKCPLLLKSPR